MEKVKWGMIGCGAVTEKKSGPGLYKAERSELRAVFDLDFEKAKDYAKRHGVPVVYQTVEEMLKDKDLDAIYLPTPPKFHKHYAMMCLEAGKIPYIEKPMASTFEECEEILNKAKEKNLPAFVAFYRRGLEKYIAIKKMLDSGKIGTVRYVQLKHIMKPEESDYQTDNLPWRVTPAAGGGKFVDMAVHVLDVTDYFFGKIVKASGNAANLGGLYKVEDTVSASFVYESGVIGSGMWCFVADKDEEEMLIVGDKGRISTTGLFFGDVHVTVGETTETFTYKEPEHIAQPYIQTIVDELTGGAKSPANLESAANVIHVVDQILKEYRKTY